VRQVLKRAGHGTVVVLTWAGLLAGLAGCTGGALEIGSKRLSGYL
jgi:hypothetical protein